MSIYDNPSLTELKNGIGLCPKCGTDLAISIRVDTVCLKKGGRTNAKLPEEIWGRVDPLLGTMTDKEVAKRLNLGLASVSKRRRDLGIKSLAEKQRDGIDALLKEGRDDEIELNYPAVSHQTIVNRRKELGLPGKVETRKRKQAKVLYEQGLTMEQIATMLRVTRQRVEQLIKDL